MNTEMKIFETEIKDIQELQAKARKYDELKVAVEKIKKEINVLTTDSNFEGYYMAISDVKNVINKHTEGLI